LERQQAFDEAARTLDLTRIERDYWRDMPDGLREMGAQSATP
jgi:hypothetical protein